MRPEHLMLPANRGFIVFTLLLALVLNLFPWGRLLWMPDFVALVLVFWNVHEPRKSGIGVGFLLGLLTDVHAGTLFGQHALAYTVIAYAATMLHRRLPWFSLAGQMLQVLPVFLLGQLIIVAVRLASGGTFPGFGLFLQSVACALLWPLADLALRAPQRRPLDPDENRPI
ncbi:MAG: rod shape-determining protein MreD [Burkholderiales bacterium]|nr:MAG: rod shape-determining protein MreD [Burkholderiales bacterium]